jgi:glycosyltransferase involved in cell wall biosynthesis
MRIALDARTVYRPQRRGTGKNLLDLYRRLARVRPEWRVIAYHRQRGEIENLLPGAEPKCVELPGDRVSAWERVRLPLAAWRDGVDVLHCPANTCPGWMPVNTLVTIHDLIPLDMPDQRPAAEVRRFEESVRVACKRAAWIVTPSSYTRDRLVREFHADANRVTVNPWPADSAVYRVPQDLWQPVLERYGVARPFVLHFGAADPRKNTAGVIEAWAQLPPGTRGDTRLLVVGLDEFTLRDMADYAHIRGVASSVVLRGFADESDLSTLLSAAMFLAFPSLSEGYGLPILDAWATGTPVLTSDQTSLPEVAGDAALLVDPTDSAAIAFGMERMLTNESLRQMLVAKGDLRGRKFTWNATAERFAGAIERAADSGSAKARAAA